ncbi:MAG: OmpA family protein [Proteobacteria bacterium]|nr:OmpA family protein [Pseudomonadota bacterium]
MAKKKKGGAPPWMATFADMSTLLLTFFVIMLSMANIDIQKFREMLGSVKEAFGVQIEQHGEYQATIDKTAKPTEKAPVPGEKKPIKEVTPQQYQSPYVAKAAKEMEGLSETAKRAKAMTEIKNAIADTKMGELADVQSGPRGIRIRIKGALLFDPGQAELKPEAKPFFDSLVEVLGKFGYSLLVEGHTDSSPISTAQFPSNWELSSYRASAVLRYLISRGVDPLRLTSIGLADNYPLADNSSEEGRAKNRRVEFVLTKQSIRPDIK